MEQPFDMESLRKRLQAMSHGQVVALAHTAGLKPSTVVKIRSGYTPDPRISNVEALIRALQVQDSQPAKAV